VKHKEQGPGFFGIPILACKKNASISRKNSGVIASRCAVAALSAVLGRPEWRLS
jgi:hypothetical protein